MMTTQQPEALRLATLLYSHEWSEAHDAADELRRLHEENSKLRREVAAISANAVDDGRAMSKLEAQLGEAVWNYGEVKRVNAQLLEALERIRMESDEDRIVLYARAAIQAAKGKA